MFSLFEEEPLHLLPYDGDAVFYRCFLDAQDSLAYFHLLLDSISWKHDEIFLFGKKITTRRKVAWYGENNLAYQYSNTIKRALPWTSELLELKKNIEQKSGFTYNSCLLNLYHNGNEGMSWHSDDEKELKKEGAIASLSLGTERKFCFRHKVSKEKVELFLSAGSLLIMYGKTQEYWQHCVPPSKKITQARINLTFRTIIENKNY